MLGTCLLHDFPIMKIHLASHYGMCFGVREALRSTHHVASSSPDVTLLGQLVHNPVVDEQLTRMGVRRGSAEAGQDLSRTHAIITAHGTSNLQRAALENAALKVTDTTCPLVRKAHDALALLVAEGYHPVVIGQRDHVEVRGLTGDFPHASVLLDEGEAATLPIGQRLGIISQTTQPLERVLTLVAAIKAARPTTEVRFIDTVCHPTKQRQDALNDLLKVCEVLIVIGGRNSNNTRQLAARATAQGAIVHQIERAGELSPRWFRGAKNVGVTAGTSTLDETVRSVMDRLQEIAADLAQSPLQRLLLPITQHA
jgi:4-hydroxy-3-methylbut-2-enyl diphosphate reductase